LADASVLLIFSYYFSSLRWIFFETFTNNIFERIKRLYQEKQGEK